jgi:hypothetical protein
MPLDDPACFRLDRVPVRPIHWLWRPYLASGKLALLDGDPGAGKARTAGYCARTLERAKKRLGVVARQARKDGRNVWLWSDPAVPQGAGKGR